MLRDVIPVLDDTHVSIRTLVQVLTGTDYPAWNHALAAGHIYLDHHGRRFTWRDFVQLAAQLRCPPEILETYAEEITP